MNRLRSEGDAKSEVGKENGKLSSSSPSAGVLQLIRLSESPFKGEIFEEAALKKGLWLFQEGDVRVVTANVQGRFSGIFGQIHVKGKSDPVEVSMVVNLDQEGTWKIDGRSSADHSVSNNGHVAALLMAAMVETGAAEPGTDFGIGSIATRIHLFSRDVRAGILHWDDSDARGVLENLHLARIENLDPATESRLREMGCKRLREIYPMDETNADYHECFAYQSGRRALQELFWADFLSNGRFELESLGCEISVSEGFGLEMIEPLDWYGQVIPEPQDDSTNWFEFECGIRIGHQKINLLPCLVKYLESKPANFSLNDFQKLPSRSRIPMQLSEGGRFVVVPVERLHTILGLLTELFDRHPVSDAGRLRLHKVRAAQLVHSQGGQQLIDRAPQELEKFGRELEQLKPKVEPSAPDGFLATLRPYQQDGFEWLQFLREQGLGGILADDMGLGKTIQTLCHLYTEKKEGRADLPCLILAPKSVVPNWEKEIRKFAPSMSVLALQGPKRKKYYPVLGHCDLVITSYPVLLRDAEELLCQPFHYVVLDEAHTIKNSSSQITRVAWRLDARHRLCLSGTPIENNLGELWSLFHFLMPGFLGSEDSFTRCFRVPIEKYRDEALRRRLARRVAPLMLRRTKTLVARDLPPKTVIVRKLELNKRQVELYEAVRASVSREVREEITRRGVEATKLVVLEALLKLRQVCCHPKLLKSMPSARKARRSAKMDLLMDWLPSMVREGRRILVFSQFTQMIDLMEQALDEKNMRYLTLTGKSKGRGELCEAFQKGKAPIFLISLRAGGTGLNLTTADTVIHFDPWWNPALESQATDRAYRIGQENPVFVYKLITEGSIEEKILLLQQKKHALFEGILGGSPQKLSFSEEELNDLFSPLER